MGAFRSTFAVIAMAVVLQLNPFCGDTGGGGGNPGTTVLNLSFPTDNGANTFAWSMEEFNGSIYIGTAREIRCVEYATADFYGVTNYSTQPEAGVNCTADPDDLPLQAKIYQLNPFTGAFTTVWEAPLVQNPSAPSKQISKYFGVRGMIVHNGVLYANTFTTGDYDKDLVAANPPSLLRTFDGVNWEEVPNPLTQVQTPFGLDTVVGFRSPASVNGRLFVTASRGLLGDGAVIEIINPQSANPQWLQVSPNTFLAYELEGYNNQLYVGTGDLNIGYSVLRWDTQYTSPFVPIITEGAGRGDSMASVVVMDVFQNQLYVGSSGWNSGNVADALVDPPQAELIRISADDSWDLVVGDTRDVNGVRKSPISGQQDGFGNYHNAHLWRGIEYRGGYYVGTNDWGWLWRDIPGLGLQVRGNIGFDMLVTCDGVNFEEITKDSFGSGEFDFGLRTLATTADDSVMYIGSANYIQGAKVWSYQGNDC
jgi:hypothetical protein